LPCEPAELRICDGTKDMQIGKTRAKKIARDPTRTTLRKYGSQSGCVGKKISEDPPD
jgi:hypothetical protein